jgi:hypothetical protein
VTATRFQVYTAPGDDLLLRVSMTDSEGRHEVIEADLRAINSAIQTTVKPDVPPEWTLQWSYPGEKGSEPWIPWVSFARALLDASREPASNARDALLEIDVATLSDTQHGTLRIIQAEIADARRCIDSAKHHLALMVEEASRGTKPA